MSLLVRKSRPTNLLDAFSDMDSVFDQFFAPPQGAMVPAVDIREEEDAYVVHADIPGVKKEDIHVSLHEGNLTIEASNSSEEQSADEAGHKYIRKERRSGTYTRRLVLADNVDDEAIEASFNDGVLELRIPKQKPEKAEPRKITIS